MALRFTAILAALLASVQAFAQPADLPIPPAKPDQPPPGIKVISGKQGRIYATDKGITIYGLDMRTLLRWGADPAQFCKDDCARDWQPMLAPPGTKPNIAFPRGFGSPPPPQGSAPRPAPAQPNSQFNADGLYNPQRAPDWTVIESAAGAQWVYKSWHLVFTRKGDRPGSTAFEGAEDLRWNTLKYVPPVPVITAPQSVSTLYHEGAYLLADKEGRVLFTGACRKECADWTPLPAPAAGRGIGEWAVSKSGDAPQWLYRGKPVYFSASSTGPTGLPAKAKALRP